MSSRLRGGRPRGLSSAEFSGCVVPPAPEDTLAKRTRNTGAVATDLAPGESREYPEVPGYEILGILGHGGMGVSGKDGSALPAPSTDLSRSHMQGPSRLPLAIWSRGDCRGTW